MVSPLLSAGADPAPLLGPQQCGSLAVTQQGLGYRKHLPVLEAAERHPSSSFHERPTSLLDRKLPEEQGPCCSAPPPGIREQCLVGLDAYGVNERVTVRR